MNFFRDVWSAILDVIYPRLCGVCGTSVADDEVICAHCMARLPRTEQASQRDNITEEVFVSVPRFRRGAAFLMYDGESGVQHLIRSGKFGMHANPEVLVQLAREAAYDLLQSDFLEDVDVIVPVPLHPRRLRERGFNQSEYIAREIGRVCGIPVDTSHLLRRVNNQHQARMGRAERADNVRGVFMITHPEDWYRKHILLVDDIITTGNTLIACMEAMKPVRGAHFSVYALAKARKKKASEIRKNN